MNKAIISIGAGSTSFFRDWQRIAQAIDAGESFAEQGDYHLNFANMEQLFTVLTPTCWTVLHKLQMAGSLPLAMLVRQLPFSADQIQTAVATLREYSLIEEADDGCLSVPWTTVELHLTAVAQQAA